MDELQPIDHWHAIESAGGPLLLLPQAALPAWDGIREPLAGRIVEATSRFREPGSAATDYDRACDVNGYLGKLRVGDDEALIIGDEPGSTVLIPARSFGSLVIAKWEYGPDEPSVVASLRGIRLQRFPEAEVSFTFRSSPQVLFDSGWPGDEVAERLVARLPAGAYVASTLLFKPAKDISLVLHWVRPAGSVG